MNYDNARRYFNNRDFRSCYNVLDNYDVRDAEWYYLRGVSAMNLGYYDEGEDYIKRAKFMEPENREYRAAYDQYISYANNYQNNANYYNENRTNLSNPGCCCCCGDCCNTCLTIWCCDSMCECCGGDLVPCC